MTSGVSGFSSTLIWNYRKVLEVSSISGPSQTREMIDLTSHDSANAFREFVPGPIAGGELTLEASLIVGDTHGQIAFHTDMQGGTKRNCFLVMPMAVGGALFFAAYATGFGGEYPFDSKIGVSGTLRVSGKPLLLPTQATGLTTPFLSGIKDGGTGSGDPLTITPTVAADAYALACTVHTTNTGVKLTATCAGGTVYIQGDAETSGAQTDAITLGAAGTTTDIIIIVYDTASPIDTAPRIYILTVTRPAA